MLFDFSQSKYLLRKGVPNCLWQNITRSRWTDVLSITICFHGWPSHMGCSFFEFVCFSRPPYFHLESLWMNSAEKVLLELSTAKFSLTLTYKGKDWQSFEKFPKTTSILFSSSCLYWIKDTPGESKNVKLFFTIFHLFHFGSTPLPYPIRVTSGS